MLYCVVILSILFLKISCASEDLSKQTLLNIGDDATVIAESAQKDNTNQQQNQNEHVCRIANDERSKIRGEIISMKLPLPVESENCLTHNFEALTGTDSALCYNLIVEQVRYYQIKGEFEQTKMENERWRETWWMAHQKWRMENKKWRTDHGEWCAQQKKRWMENELMWVEQNKKLKQLWVTLQEQQLRMDQAIEQVPIFMT